MRMPFLMIISTMWFVCIVGSPVSIIEFLITCGFTGIFIGLDKILDNLKVNK